MPSALFFVTPFFSLKYGEHSAISGTPPEGHSSQNVTNCVALEQVSVPSRESGSHKYRRAVSTYILVDSAVRAGQSLLDEEAIEEPQGVRSVNTSPPPAFPCRLCEWFGIILHIHVEHGRASTRCSPMHVRPNSKNIRVLQER